MQKDCGPPSASSRKRPKAMGVAQLEKKLDSLVSLFTLTTSNRTMLNEETKQAPPISQLEELRCLSHANIHMNVDENFTTYDTTPSGEAGIATPDFQPSLGIGILQPAYDFNDLGPDADLLLELFRQKMAEQMPFVIIPSEWGSDKLRAQRPFLWKAIMTAASYHNILRQEAMGWSVMQDFTTRLLFKAEASLDLLQGVLVHLNWLVYLHSLPNPRLCHPFDTLQS